MSERSAPDHPGVDEYVECIEFSLTMGLVFAILIALGVTSFFMFIWIDTWMMLREM